MPSPRRQGKTAERQIIVKQSREIQRGRNADTGREWAMYQLIATKPDGTPINDPQGEPLNLRSFDDMPTHEVLDVEVTPFISEQWGTSYTVKLKGQSETMKQITELKDRIARLESHIFGSEQAAPSAGPPPPPPPPGAATPPPMPTTPPVQAGSADIDDIPF